MSGELLLRIFVTTLAWGGLCAAVALFWFYGLPVLFRWHRAAVRWLSVSPLRLLFATLGAFALVLAVLVWAALFELVGALL